MSRRWRASVPGTSNEDSSIETFANKMRRVTFSIEDSVDAWVPRGRLGVTARPAGGDPEPIRFVVGWHAHRAG